MMRSVRSIAWSMVLALILALAAPATTAKTSAPTESVFLETGKGKLVHVARAVTNVFLADPAIADVDVKSPRLIYLLGKKAGQTTLFAVGEGDEIVFGATITVSHNLVALNEALANLAAGHPSASTIGSAVVLVGNVPSAAAAEDARRIASGFVDEKQIVNKLKIDAPNQITLRVRMLEMSRQVTHELGVNWDGVLGSGSFLFGIATGSPVVAAGTVLGGANGSSRQFQTRQDGTNSIVGSIKTSKLDINTLIDALEKNGTVKTLAEPNLSALSGTPASFLAGGEFPVPIPQGNNNIAIEYKKFGVSLSFVATLVGDGRINLHVNPEVSQLSTAGAIQISGISIPSLSTRRAETTVDLGSGQSFAIAGLLQNGSQNDLSSVPWLGEVPIIGALFRSTKFQKNETELVIIVTPFISRPVSASTDALTE